jgi:hypothetical protein
MALIEPPDASVLNITPDENSRRLVRHVGRRDTVSRMSLHGLSFVEGWLGPAGTLAARRGLDSAAAAG